MEYIVEFYPEEGLHPDISDEDLLFRNKAEAPFPVLEVGDVVSLLTLKFAARQTIGADHWVVRRRHFIFWDTGCTAMYWCVPNRPSAKG